MQLSRALGELLQMAGRENMQAFNKVPEMPPIFTTKHSNNYFRTDFSMLVGDSGLMASHKWDMPLYILFADLNLQCALRVCLKAWCPLSRANSLIIE